MSSILSYAASGFGLFAVAAVALFTAAAHAPTAPFFWHPISMVLSFGFFMVQGVLILTLAVVSYTVGFASIIYNKYAKGSNHFTTWHSWFGLLTAAFCYSQLLLGLYMYYTWPKIVLSHITSNRPKDLTVKRWHRVLAIIAYVKAQMCFLSGLLTCIISLWSSFAIKNIPWEVSTMILAAFVLIGLSTSLLGLRIELPEWLQ